MPPSRIFQRRSSNVRTRCKLPGLPCRSHIRTLRSMFPLPAQTITPPPRRPGPPCTTRRSWRQRAIFLRRLLSVSQGLHGRRRHPRLPLLPPPMPARQPPYGLRRPDRSPNLYIEEGSRRSRSAARHGPQGRSSDERSKCSKRWPSHRTPSHTSKDSSRNTVTTASTAAASRPASH